MHDTAQHESTCFVRMCWQPQQAGCILSTAREHASSSRSLVSLIQVTGKKPKLGAALEQAQTALEGEYVISRNAYPNVNV